LKSSAKVVHEMVVQVAPLIKQGICDHWSHASMTRIMVFILMLKQKVFWLVDLLAYWAATEKN
jgi:hypothetical protein